MAKSTRDTQRVIEFNIPTTKGVEKARGLPTNIVVGNRKIKFVIQYDREGKLTVLTHFASGYKIGSLNDARVELMCKLSPYHRFTRHELAKFLLDKIIARIGVGEGAGVDRRGEGY